MTKITYEDKINIYNEKCSGKSSINIGKKYGLDRNKVDYIFKLVNKHGFNILRNGNHKYYSIHEKERIINRVLMGNESIISISIDEGLASSGMLVNWVKKYKENGYNIVERKRGRSAMPKVTKKKEKETKDETIKRCGT